MVSVVASTGLKIKEGLNSRAYVFHILGVAALVGVQQLEVFLFLDQHDLLEFLDQQIQFQVDLGLDCVDALF